MQETQFRDDYRVVFDAVSDAIIIYDLDSARVVEANPAACALLGYRREELLGLLPTDLLQEDSHSVIADFPQAARDGRTISLRARARRKDGSELMIEARGAPFAFRGAPAVLTISRDVTEQVAQERALEERVTERTRDLSTLLDMSHSLASTLDPDSLMQLALERLNELIPHHGAAIQLLDGEEMHQVATRRTVNKDRPAPRRPSWSKTSIVARLRENKPVLIADVRGEGALAREYREAVGDLAEAGLDYVRSWLAVPLAVKEVVIGNLALAHGEVGYFTNEHIALAGSIANHVAVAIENARLFAETEQKAREIEALLQANERLFESLELEAVLQNLADISVDILQADKSMVVMIEGDRQRLRAHRNFSRALVEYFSDRDAVAQSGPTQVRVISDFATWDSPTSEILTAEGGLSGMDVPIRSGDRTYGAFGVIYARRHVATPQEQRLFLALAGRAAAAIDNAELYRRAQQAASLEERQRLARELHDSVSQALYGIALGARTARTQLERDPGAAREPLDYVLSLAEAGLAEMRALIFELRPESLENEGLVAALEKQVAATRARHGISVKSILPAEPEVSLEVKEAAFRIAQEALQNVVKHAHATNALLSLRCQDSRLLLEVSDDGLGFDTSRSYPGHLGLHSMPERARRVGGQFFIDSGRGKGTKVSASFPLP
jgi:PAS domain S-box-containing protein